MWEMLKIKLEETSFFAAQLASYSRHPKLFLFYLSAYLTSARSVTLHLQAQFKAADAKEYTQLRDEMLSDPVAQFFLDTRNYSAHQAYPPLTVSQLSAVKDPTTGERFWTEYAHLGLPHENAMSFLEQLLRRDWEERSIGEPPVEIRYVWRFIDFPGGGDIPEACQAFAERLWIFVFKFRNLWQAERNKAELEKKLTAEQRVFWGIDPDPAA